MVIPKVCVPIRTCKVAISYSSQDVANKKTNIHHKSPIMHHPSLTIIIIIITIILRIIIIIIISHCGLARQYRGRTFILAQSLRGDIPVCTAHRTIAPVFSQNGCSNRDECLDPCWRSEAVGGTYQVLERGPGPAIHQSSWQQLPTAIAAYIEQRFEGHPEWDVACSIEGPAVVERSAKCSPTGSVPKCFNYSRSRVIRSSSGVEEETMQSTRSSRVTGVA